MASAHVKIHSFQQTKENRRTTAVEKMRHGNGKAVPSANTGQKVLGEKQSAGHWLSNNRADRIESADEREFFMRFCIGYNDNEIASLSRGTRYAARVNGERPFYGTEATRGLPKLPRCPLIRNRRSTTVSLEARATTRPSDRKPSIPTAKRPATETLSRDSKGPTVSNACHSALSGDLADIISRMTRAIPPLVEALSSDEESKPKKMRLESTACINNNSIKGGNADAAWPLNAWTAKRGSAGRESLLGAREVKKCECKALETKAEESESDESSSDSNSSKSSGSSSSSDCSTCSSSSGSSSNSSSESSSDSSSDSEDEEPNAPVVKTKANDVALNTSMKVNEALRAKVKVAANVKPPLETSLSDSDNEAADIKAAVIKYDYANDTCVEFDRLKLSESESSENEEDSKRAIKAEIVKTKPIETGGDSAIVVDDTIKCQASRETSLENKFKASIAESDIETKSKLRVRRRLRSDTKSKSAPVKLENLSPIATRSTKSRRKSHDYEITIKVKADAKSPSLNYHPTKVRTKPVTDSDTESSYSESDPSSSDDQSPRKIAALKRIFLSRINKAGDTFPKAVTLDTNPLAVTRRVKRKLQQD